MCIDNTARKYEQIRKDAQDAIIKEAIREKFKLVFTRKK